MRAAGVVETAQLLLDLDAHHPDRADVAVDRARSTPGIHVSSPPNSRRSFQTSSGLRSIETSAFPSAMATSWQGCLGTLSGHGSAVRVTVEPPRDRVRRRRCEHAAAPTVGRAEQRPRIVLPHPAREVAPGPRREVGRRDRGPGAERVAQDALQEPGEPEVAAERAVYEPAVVGAGRDRLAPRASRSRSPARCLRRSSGRRPRPRRRRRARGPARVAPGRSASGSATRAPVRPAARPVRGSRAPRAARGPSGQRSFSSRPVRPSARNTP